MMKHIAISMETQNNTGNPTFHIALYQPEIPLNTGNIGRLCLGANTALHIIKPMRFFIDDKHIKKAGLDYWDKVNLTIHDDWQSFLSCMRESNIYLCSTKATTPYHKCSFKRGDVFVFGPESRGLPFEILSESPKNMIKIPMSADIRSINLANSVAIVLYEALRQIDFDM